MNALVKSLFLFTLFSCEVPLFESAQDSNSDATNPEGSIKSIELKGDSLGYKQINVSLDYGNRVSLQQVNLAGITKFHTAKEVIKTTQLKDNSIGFVEKIAVPEVISDTRTDVNEDSKIDFSFAVAKDNEEALEQASCNFESVFIDDVNCSLKDTLSLNRLQLFDLKILFNNLKIEVDGGKTEIKELKNSNNLTHYFFHFTDDMKMNFSVRNILKFFGQTYILASKSGETSNALYWVDFDNGQVKQVGFLDRIEKIFKFEGKIVIQGQYNSNRGLWSLDFSKKQIRQLVNFKGLGQDYFYSVHILNNKLIYEVVLEGDNHLSSFIYSNGKSKKIFSLNITGTSSNSDSAYWTFWKGHYYRFDSKANDTKLLRHNEESGVTEILSSVFTSAAFPRITEEEILFSRGSYPNNIITSFDGENFNNIYSGGLVKGELNGTFLFMKTSDSTGLGLYNKKEGILEYYNNITGYSYYEKDQGYLIGQIGNDRNIYKLKGTKFEKVFPQEEVTSNPWTRSSRGGLESRMMTRIGEYSYLLRNEHVYKVKTHYDWTGVDIETHVNIDNDGDIYSYPRYVPADT